MRAPINKFTYDRLKAIYEKEMHFWNQLGKNSMDKEEQKKMKAYAGGKTTNRDRSNMEVYEFIKNPPQSYFLYINKEFKATTWTGQILGNVFWGSIYRSNFGDHRRNIDVIGINGIKYHGTYFQSAGDYARIKAYKNQ